jgi:hypothetical protein
MFNDWKVGWELFIGFSFDLFDCVGKEKGVSLANGRKGFQFD